MKLKEILSAIGSAIAISSLIYLIQSTWNPSIERSPQETAIIVFCASLAFGSALNQD